VTDTTTRPAPPADVQTSSLGWAVPTRRISFSERLEDLPRHFAADGNLIASHLAAAISTILPDGEEFFVAAVRQYRDQITDPDLKRQIAGFIGQESVHGREHRALDDRLAALGYPTKQCEWLVRRYMRLQALRRPMNHLSHTAASEHVTATLAEACMRDPAVRAMFGPVVGDIYLWHSLEESEHKAVAFDVYRAVGGSERRRVRSGRETRWSLVAACAVFVVAGLLRDREAYRPGNLRRSWRQFKRSPLMRREVWERFKEYERPDFHPNDRDTTALVETWRAELFGDTGSLSPLVAGLRGPNAETGLRGPNAEPGAR
jgi:predicted metal-dependent hydrolase